MSKRDSALDVYKPANSKHLSWIIDSVCVYLLAAVSKLRWMATE